MRVLRITAKNFYSFKELKLDFTKLEGITRIIGKNYDSGGSNGSGKSVIFECVSWGLFGKSIRKSTEESLVFNQVGKDCEVTVILEKDGVGTCSISRRRRPTGLDFKINGVSKNKDTAVVTQKFIEEIIEADYKSFLASTVFRTEF
jgi:DNA repair exonuclease SbcCD ATPase subunit